MWESEIAKAIEQAVFFIPIVTPRGVASEYCQFEFNSFLARERALGRSDLVFPILYISVPALRDETKWRNDPVLSIIGKRQYVDWRPFRHVAVNTAAFGEAIERFCAKIVETLREPWLSPEERRQLEAEARKRAEDEERIRLEAEARRQAEEEERLRKEAQAEKRAEQEAQKREEAERQRQESEAKKRAEEAERLRLEAEARRQAEEEEKLRKEARAKKQADEEDAKRRREEAETQRRLAEEAERRRQQSEAKRRTEEQRRKPDELTPAAVGARRQAENHLLQLADVGGPEMQEQSSTPWRPSRRDWVIAGMSVAVIAAGAATWWSHRPNEEVQRQTAVTVPSPTPEKEEAHPPATVAAPPPAAQPQTTATAPSQPQTAETAPAPATGKKWWVCDASSCGWRDRESVTAPAPAAENEETHPPAGATAPASGGKKWWVCDASGCGWRDRESVTAPAPAARKEESQPQTTVTAPPPAEKQESHGLANLTALTAAQERALKPGDPFKEGSDCPEMIVVPAGRFLMGSPEGQGNDRERPQHEVTLTKPFAVAKFELTFDEWDACAARRGCRRDVSDSGWGRGRRPAMNMSWDDAQAYVKWLSGITGKPYRLLSEAEYEYAARAGGQTKYPWGDDIKLSGETMANCNGCGSQLGGKQTATVGSFPANLFGLYDMVGNVSEWTQDCWNDNYTGAPADGSPWTNGNCNFRIVRGGSWGDNPGWLRLALRYGDPAGGRGDRVGFRVARTLTP
jgi:formylglycine-generating enzyme required for sulfatase activity